MFGGGEKGGWWVRMCWEDEMCGGLVLALALVFGGCVELGFGRGFGRKGGFVVGSWFYLVRAICIHGGGPWMGPPPAGIWDVWCVYAESEWG